MVNDQPAVLDVDNVIICAGQESYTAMFDELKAAGKTCISLVVRKKQVSWMLNVQSVRVLNWLR